MKFETVVPERLPQVPFVGGLAVLVFPNQPPNPVSKPSVYGKLEMVVPHCEKPLSANSEENRVVKISFCKRVVIGVQSKFNLGSQQYIVESKHVKILRFVLIIVSMRLTDVIDS